MTKINSIQLEYWQNRRLQYKINQYHAFLQQRIQIKFNNISKLKLDNVSK